MLFVPALTNFRKQPFWLVLVATVLIPSVHADVITDWNNSLLVAVRNESTSPPLAARNLAILHAAIYDSVNGIARTHQPFFVDVLPSDPVSPEAAALGAAYQVLLNLYPGQQGSFESDYARSLSQIPPGPARDNGLAVGKVVAEMILFHRNSDGSSTSIPYIPSNEPGQWRRTPPFFRPPELSQWPHVVPFALTNGMQFRPLGPPALDSADYTADFNQVKQLGALNNSTRTAEQTDIARFWSDFSYTVTPPGHWNQIAQNIAATRTNGLAENARLFALLNIAMADGGIACWDAKYAFNFWRPVTAIQQGHIDPNSNTTGDANWQPLLSTPSFPEYPSGHSTFSGAAGCVLTNFYGTDALSFAIGSDTLFPLLRYFDSVERAVDEVGMSRIYGGIHFLSADLDGIHTGHLVGEYVYNNFLRPLPAPATFDQVRIGEGGHFEFQVKSAVGSEHLVEISSDLQIWTAIVTNRAPFIFRISELQLSSNLFFRTKFVR